MRRSDQFGNLSACQRKGKEQGPNCRGAQSHRDFRWSPCALWKISFIFTINIFFLLLFAGCVPAKLPPQLAATPGAEIIITEQEYDAGAFKVRYPPEWRVITSAATSPTAVIFASPDDTAIMLFGVDTTEAPMPDTNAQIRTETRQITLENGTKVTAILNAPADSWETIAPLFEQIVESVN